MIRFIHAADLHLDTPFSGLEQISSKLGEKLREAPFKSLQKIVDTALEKEVDFVLLAGDLYNTERVNIKAQSLFIEQLKRLEKAEIAVFLIRGNHDYISENAQTLTLPFPTNVYTYERTVDTHVFETKTKKRVAISGFSYDSKWIFDRKVKEYPNRFPNVDMHIGLLHGAIESANSENGNYAPFSVDELRMKNYDYWALGHVHQKQHVAENPTVIYPGNIQGLHKNEMGEKGCLLVEWEAQEERIEFIPTAPIIWERLIVSLAEIDTISLFIQKLQQLLVENQTPCHRLVHLIIEADDESEQDLIHFIQGRDFTRQMTEQVGLDNVWLGTYELIVKETTNQQALEQLYPDEWQAALEKVKAASEFSEITDNIFNQIPGRYLNQGNSKEYREEMIQKALAKIHLKH